MNQTLIIVPTYNEKENVQALADELYKCSAELDVLFVDDNSPDGTGAVCDRLAADDKRINVLHRKDKQGLGRAYVAGFKWALEREYNYIFEMDADFSHRPSDIPALREAADNADLVLGSRYKGGVRVINWPLNRLVLSKGAAWYVQLITGMPFADPTGGYKCYRREVLESIPLDEIKSNGYSFQIEMTYQAWMRGFKVVEIPITFEERRQGHSKMNSSIIREALWRVWKLPLAWKGRRSPKKIHLESIVNKGGG